MDLEKKILKDEKKFAIIPKLFPLERGPGPLVKQTCIPFIYGCFVPSLVEFGPVDIVKLTMTTDIGQSLL